VFSFECDYSPGIEYDVNASDWAKIHRFLEEIKPFRLKQG